MKKTKLIELVENKNFTESKELVKKYLLSAEIADPRDDLSYYLPVDYLGYEILKENGPQAYCSYWLEIIKLFKENLEPNWGHLHKGHFFYRLGVGKLAVNLDEAKKILELVIEEEEKTYIKKYQEELNLKVPFEDGLAKFPENALLVLIDIIGDNYFENKGEKARFYRGLAYHNWDLIWEPSTIDPDLLLKAIKKIVPEKGYQRTLIAYKELETIFNLKLPVAIIVLEKYFIEVLLYYMFYYKLKITDIKNKSLDKVDLGDLLREGIKKNIFVDDSVSSLFFLVYILSEKMFKRESKEKDKIFNKRLGVNIAVCIKLLVDMALIKWSDNFINND